MIDSFKKNSIGIVLISISAILVCMGQLMWKLSGGGNHLYIMIGFLMYGFGAVIMTAAYKFGSLSVLQPMLSINYALSVILAKIVLNESVTPIKIIGIVLIIIGIVFIGGGDE